MRIHRVYCKSVSGTNEIFKIDETQSHHLIRALRLKEEDIVKRKLPKGTTGVVVTEISAGSPLMFVSVNDVLVELQKKKIKNSNF